ncbi:MAG: hypothetical protein Q7S39_04635 [Ignavibacteria bacterium]|nr:hypothetical protein [Ignavibacteria bacterium]
MLIKNFNSPDIYVGGEINNYSSALAKNFNESVAKATGLDVSISRPKGCGYFKIISFGGKKIE